MELKNASALYVTPNGFLDAGIIFDMCVTKITNVWKKCGDLRKNARIINQIFLVFYCYVRVNLYV